MRSVHIQKDKSIFKLSELPVEAYASSMGLPGAPQIRLLEGKGAGRSKARGGPRDDPGNFAEIKAGSKSEEDDEGKTPERGDELPIPLGQIPEAERPESEGGSVVSAEEFPVQVSKRVGLSDRSL